jgi:hypothetical protein
MCDATEKNEAQAQKEIDKEIAQAEVQELAQSLVSGLSKLFNDDYD